MAGRVVANLPGDEPWMNLALCRWVWTFTKAVSDSLLRTPVVPASYGMSACMGADLVALDKALRKLNNQEPSAARGLRGRPLRVRDRVSSTKAGNSAVRRMLVSDPGRHHMTFVERANWLNRPLRTRTVGGVGAPASNGCPPDQVSLRIALRVAHSASAKRPKNKEFGTAFGQYPDGKE